jgi:hypothetical protein
MRYAVALLLVGCAQNADPPLGTASLASNGGPTVIAAAWLERGYSWFGSSDQAEVVYSVSFTLDPAANTATCKDRATLMEHERLDLNSTHVIHQGGSPPQLETGTFPIGSEMDLPSGPPPMMIATFAYDTSLTSGTVKVDTSDAHGITGSFTASGGTPTMTLTGAFDAPICDLGVGN